MELFYNYVKTITLGNIRKQNEFLSRDFLFQHFLFGQFALQDLIIIAHFPKLLWKQIYKNNHIKLNYCQTIETETN